MEDTLAALADTVILDAETQYAGIIYNTGVSGCNKMASPRGFEPLLSP